MREVLVKGLSFLAATVSIIGFFSSDNNQHQVLFGFLFFVLVCWLLTILWEKHNAVALMVLSNRTEIYLKKSDGSEAVFRKEIEVKALKSVVRIHKEEFGCDGKLGDATVYGAKIVNQRSFGGRNTFDFEFSPPIRRGETRTLIFHCELIDAFAEASEYWNVVIRHPTRSLLIRVFFPSHVSPRLYSKSRIVGSVDRVIHSGPPMLHASQESTSYLEWDVLGPKINIQYVVKWTWPLR